MTGIRIDRHQHVVSLTFDRTEKKNAITDAMYGTLADALIAAESDPEARAVLLRAEGDTFTAGNDMADFASVGAAKSDGPRNVRRFLDALGSATRPIVAAVQGNAVGVGTTLLLHCDYVVLADTARLLAPFVNLALVPEAASSLLLPARIGHVRAFAMLGLGEPVDAATALDWGLANKVVTAGDLDATATAVAARLAAQPLGALAATKRLMRDPDAMRQRMDIESAEFASRLTSPEAREAFAAFAERRKPDFTKVEQGAAA